GRDIRPSHFFCPSGHRPMAGIQTWPTGSLTANRFRLFKTPKRRKRYRLFETRRRVAGPSEPIPIRAPRSHKWGKLAIWRDGAKGRHRGKPKEDGSVRSGVTHGGKHRRAVDDPQSPGWHGPTPAREERVGRAA